MKNNLFSVLSMPKSILSASYVDLTPEQELYCATLSELGDTDARQMLILANRKKMEEFAKKQGKSVKGLNEDDRVIAGEIALAETALRYKADSTISFFTYATLWFRKYAHELAKEKSCVYIPSNRSKKQVISSADFEWQYTNEDLIEKKKISRFDTINEEWLIPNADYSLDADGMFEENKTEMLWSAMDGLIEQDRKVVEMYHGLGGQEQMTEKEVAAQMNTSRSMVNKRRMRAYEQLKPALVG